MMTVHWMSRQYFNLTTQFMTEKLWSISLQVFEENVDEIAELQQA